MILINTLAMVAAAAAILVAMLGGDAPAVDRATGFATATRALAIARGGEVTAIAALRRAAALPQADPFAAVVQRPTPIAGGRFALTVSDAQSRFNVNAAAGAGEPVLAAITAALGLDADVASRIAASIAARGPVRDIGELTRAGLDEATLARLRPLVTALPGDAPVDVNSASPVLLGILVGDAATGRLLAARRAQAGRLTGDDLAAVGVRLPTGTGFTSSHFRVTATVVQGDTRVVLTSLIERRPDGAVVTFARQLGPPS